MLSRLLKKIRFTDEAELIEEISRAHFDPDSHENGFKYEGDITFFLSGKVKNPNETKINIKTIIPYSMECSRCMKRTEKEFVIIEDLIYSGMLSEDLFDRGKIYWGDDIFLFKELDFFDEIRQRMELLMPIKFLCDDSCKGLCAICGKNQNLGICSHNIKIDPRLMPLAGIKISSLPKKSATKAQRHKKIRNSECRMRN